jgi:hypothetical protein
MEFLICLALEGCVTATMTQKGSTGVAFRAFKTVALFVHATPATKFDSDREFGVDEIAVLNEALAQRLQTMGYANPASGTTAELTVDISVTKAKRGNPAARFFVGLGAGRAALTFDAAFKDSDGRNIAEFQGRESFTGTDLATKSADDNDIKYSAVTRAVQQVTEFMLNNGNLRSH